MEPNAYLCFATHLRVVWRVQCVPTLFGKGRACTWLSALCCAVTFAFEVHSGGNEGPVEVRNCESFTQRVSINLCTVKPLKLRYPLLALQGCNLQRTLRQLLWANLTRLLTLNAEKLKPAMEPDYSPALPKVQPNASKRRRLTDLPSRLAPAPSMMPTRSPSKMT